VRTRIESRWLVGESDTDARRTWSRGIARNHKGRARPGRPRPWLPVRENACQGSDMVENRIGRRSAARKYLSTYIPRDYREFANSHTRLLSALTPRALPRNSANAEWPTLPEAWVKFADGSRGDIVFPRTWIDLIETNARGPILSSLKFSDPPRCSIRRRGDPDGRPPSARWLRGAEFRLSDLRYLGTAFRPLSLAWIMSYLFLTLDCTEGKTIGEGCVP